MEGKEIETDVKLMLEPYSLNKFRDNADKKSRNYIKGTKRMSGAQIFQLIRTVNFALKVNKQDPYNDDYYFLKAQAFYNDSNNRSSLPTAGEISINEILEDMTLIREKGVELFLEQRGEIYNTNTLLQPSSLKEDSIEKIEALQKQEEKYKGLISKWKSENKVLGQTTKSKWSEPKQLVDIDLIVSDESFKSTIWKARVQINEVFSTILLIEEETLILKNLFRDITKGNINHSSEVDIAEKKQVNLCNKLGMLLGMSSLSEKEMTLNFTTLKSIIWLEKGKKALTRSFKVLFPYHLHILLQIICENLVFFVCSKNSEIDFEIGSTIGKQFEKLQLPQLCKCLNKLLKALSPAKVKFLMNTVGGKEVVPNLLIHGQRLAETNKFPLKTNQKWDKYFVKFLEMANESME